MLTWMGNVPPGKDQQLCSSKTIPYLWNEWIIWPGAIWIEFHRKILLLLFFLSFSLHIYYAFSVQYFWFILYTSTSYFQIYIIYIDVFFERGDILNTLLSGMSKNIFFRAVRYRREGKRYKYILLTDIKHYNEFIGTV